VQLPLLHRRGLTLVQGYSSFDGAGMPTLAK
jgi:hypothetical protein